jgi:flagellar biosynthesis chaperone FliJ
MNMERPPCNADTDLARRELSELRRQTRSVRTQLRHLHQDLASLKGQLPSALHTDLLAANEQLLLSSLQRTAGWTITRARCAKRRTMPTVIR